MHSAYSHNADTVTSQQLKRVCVTRAVYMYNQWKCHSNEDVRNVFVNVHLLDLPYVHSEKYTSFKSLDILGGMTLQRNCLR